jgi:hypothetical protein
LSLSPARTWLFGSRIFQGLSDNCAALGSKPRANRKLETSKEVRQRFCNRFSGLPALFLARRFERLAAHEPSWQMVRETSTAAVPLTANHEGNIRHRRHRCKKLGALGILAVQG